MEISQFRGFSELPGIEDPFFNSQWPFNSFDDQLSSINMEATAVDHLYAPVFDHHYKPIIMETSPRPAKQLKTSSWNSCISSSDQSLMNQNLHYGTNQTNFLNPNEEGTVSSKNTIGFTYGAKTTTTKFTTPQDHILAERKRREKLSQRFIALSALVPGLKKTDKASVLGDAIKYLKNLQEKVKTLEEQTKKRSNIESVVFVKKYDGEISTSDEKFSGGLVLEQLPEIEARFSGKDVLIKVHCEKKTGVVEEILAEIGKLNLSVINTTAMTFASYAVNITVVAQMDQEFTMTMKDLVKNLHTAFKRFM